MKDTTKAPRGLTVAFWIFTALFCLLMLFTAWWEIGAPQQSVPEFAKLGFTAPWFRLELSVAKVLGVVALLLPLGARAKEWAYCGFAINLVSAFVTHISIHDVPVSYISGSIASVLWVGSYVCWRKLGSR
jgi:uncharacterized membrane protein YphA (DoxX/SURF4 family)